MLKDSSKKTLADLQEAFAGESQANRKYLAFAKKADEEGFPQIAKLFRAAADAETVHAHNHLREMGGIKSTKENLQEAIAGETHEFKEMYPAMMEDAKSEEEDGANQSFYYANSVEEVHAELYKKYADNIDSLEEVDLYVCQVCGNTVENEAPDVCPVCGNPKEKFNKID